MTGQTLSEKIFSRAAKQEARAGEFVLAPEADWVPAVEWVHALGWERYRSGLTDDAYALEPMYLRLPAAEERWRERPGHV
jgi:tRNA A37 threonylcarbamoyladenosine modification protein TsaB